VARADVNTLAEEKCFYERFWNLLNDRQLMEVFEKFGPTIFRRSSVLEGFETFIRAQDFRGKVCCEIGTLNGLTALVLARYFEKVVTIDIIDSPHKEEIARMLRVNNVEFVNVKDNAAKAEAIGALDFDAAYVDGDHTHDTQQDFALVRRCGRVLFHEHWDAQPPVMNLVKTLGPSVVASGKFALWTA